MLSYTHSTDKQCSFSKSDSRIEATTTLSYWARHEAIPFSDESPEPLNAEIDRRMAILSTVELLGFGEALHGVKIFSPSGIGCSSDW